MSKAIGDEDKVVAWNIPEITDLNKKNKDNADGLTAKERRAVEQEVNKIRQQAYQEGFKKGMNDGSNQISQAVQSLLKIISGMSEPIKHMDNRVEDELVKLAVSIAKQIVRRELKTDPGQVVAVVRESLSIIPASSQNVRVFLNPEDSHYVRQIIPPNAGERTWEIIDDPVLSRGSCRVETETTVIDATYESRIAAIAAEILGSERVDD